MLCTTHNLVFYAYKLDQSYIALHSKNMKIFQVLEWKDWFIFPLLHFKMNRFRRRKIKKNHESFCYQFSLSIHVIPLCHLWKAVLPYLLFTCDLSFFIKFHLNLCSHASSVLQRPIIRLRWSLLKVSMAR